MATAKKVQKPTRSQRAKKRKPSPKPMRGVAKRGTTKNTSAKATSKLRNLKKKTLRRKLTKKVVKGATRKTAAKKSTKKTPRVKAKSVEQIAGYIAGEIRKGAPPGFRLPFELFRQLFKPTPDAQIEAALQKLAEQGVISFQPDGSPDAYVVRGGA